MRNTYEGITESGLSVSEGPWAVLHHAAHLSRWVGGGRTWVFRGAHTFVIKMKKYP